MVWNLMYLKNQKVNGPNKVYQWLITLENWDIRVHNQQIINVYHLFMNLKILKMCIFLIVFHILILFFYIGFRRWDLNIHIWWKLVININLQEDYKSLYWLYLTLAIILFKNAPFYAVEDSIQDRRKEVGW